MVKQKFVTLAVALTIVAAAALLLAAVSTGDVEAARGGKRGGRSSGGTTTVCGTCVLTVSPNPVPAHTQPTVRGSGFTPGVNYFVQVNGDIFSTAVTADGSGSFTFVYTYKDLFPGSYTMVASNDSGKAAEYTFTVQ